MSALAEEDGWPFHYRDLSVAGVVLTEEQMTLYSGSQRRPQQALTVGFVQDPFEPRLPKVAEAWSTEREYTKWFLPGIVDLRPEWWEEATDRADPVWLRYPTVPAKAIVYDRWMGDAQWGAVEGFRLWMLTPINRWDVDVVLEEYRTMEAAYIDPVRKWCDVLRGDRDPCSLYAETTGRAELSHEHESDGDGIWLCREAERWIEEQYEVFCALDDDGGVLLKALPEPELPPELMATWRNLVTTSQQVSFQLFNAVPEWERREHLRTERHYCPWLS